MAAQERTTNQKREQLNDGTFDLDFGLELIVEFKVNHCVKKLTLLLIGCTRVNNLDQNQLNQTQGNFFCLREFQTF